MKSPRFAQTMIALSIAQVFSMALPFAAFASEPVVASEKPEVLADAPASAASGAPAATETESAVEQVVIQAQRSSNALARAAQKEAANLINLMTAEDIKKLAVASGMITLMEDGIGKVKQGITTVEEILRVTREE